MTVYGKDFAAIYNDKWAMWGPRMWPFLAEKVEKQVPDAKTWLDLCCGAGSLLKLVCENGFSATGVDISTHQLRHARRNAPAARLLVQDIRELSLPDRFDVITCMFDSLNYLTTKKDLLKAFRNARRHLEAGGLFAFDMNTFEGLQDHWRRTSTLANRDTTLIVQTSFDERRALGRCVITGFVRTGKLYRKFREVHFERGYRVEEIEDLLGKAGFSFRKYDCPGFGRPRKRSPRLMYLCGLKLESPWPKRSVSRHQLGQTDGAD